MKKKIVLIMLTLATAAMIAGCGAKKEQSGEVITEPVSEETLAQAPEHSSFASKTPVEANTPLKDMMVEEYVTLGDYNNLVVDLPKASKEEIEQTALQVYLNGYPMEMGVTDRAVEVGDTANIDYEGKKDGVAFAGGTAQGSNLTIGSGQFIDGFEDGLVGVMPGETVDLDLTFPENYGSEELAGQAVVFTVTVNYIIPAGIDDEAVVGLNIPDVTDKDSFYAYVEDYINSYYASDSENEVMTAFLNSCSFDAMPEVMVEQYRQNLKDNMTASAEGSGMDVDTFMNVYYGMDLETFAINYAEQSLMLNVASQALANKENLNISDEELDKRLNEYATMSGTTVDDLLGTASKEEFREYFMYQAVVEFLSKIALGE